MIPTIILSLMLSFFPISNVAETNTALPTTELDSETVVQVENENKEKPQEEPVEPEKPQKPLLELSRLEYTIEKDATVKLVYNLEENAGIKFSSKDPSIVSVDEHGTIQGRKAGNTTLTLTVEKDDRKEEYEITIIVFERTGSVKFEYKEINLSRDHSYKMPYKIEGNVSDQELIWESDNPSIASVENGTITGHKIGTTQIHVSAPNTRDTVIVRVVAPLRELVFNPESMKLTVGHEKEMADLVFVPYDTTTSKDVEYVIEDDTIVSIKDNRVKALKAGTTNIVAKIGDVSATMAVEVEPQLTESGSNIVEMKIEDLENGQMVLFHDDLSQYKANTFALKLPTRDIVTYLNENDSLDLIIVLHDKLYEEGMKKIEVFELSEQIMALLNDKTLNVHLLNQANKPMMIYEFNSSQSKAMDLRFNISKMSEMELNQYNIKGNAYSLLFKNKYGFPLGTVVRIPAEKIDAHFNQLHFIYEIAKDELVDTNQAIAIDSQDYLELEVSENNYVITLTKISAKSDAKVIATLSVVLLILLGAFGFAYFKKHKKN